MPSLFLQLSIASPSSLPSPHYVYVHPFSSISLAPFATPTSTSANLSYVQYISSIFCCVHVCIQFCYGKTRYETAHKLHSIPLHIKFNGQNVEKSCYRFKIQYRINRMVPIVAGAMANVLHSTYTHTHTSFTQKLVHWRVQCIRVAEMNFSNELK